MDIKQARREASRSKKQRQRDRQRELRRLAAEAQAKRQEEADERLVPAVMRCSITSLEGYVLVGPRARIINGRAERSNPVAASKSAVFTFELKSAAARLQHDWDEVGAGVNVGAVDYLRSGGRGSGDVVGHGEAMSRQVDARARLEGAMATLGAFTPAICRVVLDGVPIAAWVQEPDPFGVVRDVRDGEQWIALGLKRLVAFYEPPRPARNLRIRTIGPGRGDYSTEVGDE